MIARTLLIEESCFFYFVGFYVCNIKESKKKNKDVVSTKGGTLVVWKKIGC